MSKERPWEGAGGMPATVANSPSYPVLGVSSFGISPTGHLEHLRFMRLSMNQGQQDIRIGRGAVRNALGVNALEAVPPHVPAGA